MQAFLFLSIYIHPVLQVIILVPPTSYMYTVTWIPGSLSRRMRIVELGLGSDLSLVIEIEKFFQNTIGYSA